MLYISKSFKIYVFIICFNKIFYLLCIIYIKIFFKPFKNIDEGITTLEVASALNDEQLRELGIKNGPTCWYQT